MSSTNTEELWKKYHITREVFDRCMEMTKHEDEKAGRILASMAFLTVAAAAIFSTFLNKGLKLEFSLFCSQSFDLIPMCFGCYVFFVIIGTMLTLEAVGPSFEVPKLWRAEKYEPKSIFFFEKISETDTNEWMNYFGRPNDEILAKACNDHIFEAYLVAIKVRRKVRRIIWGKRFFYVAVIVLMALVVVGWYAYAVTSA